jgi:hypothetical protein
LISFRKDRFAEKTEPPDPTSEDGAVNSERTDPSNPRPAPPPALPLPKAPKPPSEADDEDAPDFPKKPASGDANGELGATVGSKRRPGSPSMPLMPVGGATGLIKGLEEGMDVTGLAKPEPVPGPVEPENPSAADPDRIAGELNENVPPEVSVLLPLNQVR